MTSGAMALVGVTVVLIMVGVVLALLVMKVGHRHEEQVFEVLADLRLHAAETAVRERRAMNQIDANTKLVERIEGSPRPREAGQ